MKRRDDPWADAKCREPQHQEWMRAHRASMWDWRIDCETQAQQKARHFKATGICYSCPLRAQCRELHDALAAVSPFRVSGIWGGKPFADRDDEDRPDFLPLAV
ncbi:WhiB family transcriptional regulator [Nocardia otitidiscaviarum]|uniref:WhiB family transcriptional regulator n=1 Tax=Nocardia otitidiscaviarum TaxID=1823 RepID=UPI000AD2891B|nr:WhiB family transcriptional regulator [Nocardia otitidiscaviarum]